jgi:hypothetical protein
MHRRINIVHILLATVLMLGMFSSCSTTKNATLGEIKPMTAGKIIRKVAAETPKYKNYESKKITVNYQDKNTKNSFSGQFKIDRDECIILTLKKLNFPLGKGMITPDSIHFVNYIDRYFVKGEISALYNLIGVDVDYDLIQALLTADVSKLLQNMYRIDSQFNPKIDRALTSGNEKRLNRYMQRMDDSEFIDYNVWVDPVFFVIRKLTFNDIKYKETLTIHYDEYEVVGRSLFPQQISFSMQTPKQNLELMIRLSRPTMNKSNDFSFSIPEKYDELKLLND